MACPAANTNSTVSIVTSVGFAALDANDYVTAVKRLRPDIAISLADVVVKEAKPSLKRMERMGDRTQSWLRVLAEGLRDSRRQNDVKKTALFAPILPLEPEQQKYYLEALEEDYNEDVDGFLVYEAASVLSIPEPMKERPRLGQCEPKDPHDLLRDVALGVDLHTVPFVNALSDAGIALDFEFPTPGGPTESDSNSEPRPHTPAALGIDLWDTSHATDLSSLKAQCTCYTCTNHHRAYLNHLLSAKEMLAWVLLQVHNHHILDQFFTGIRESLQNNTFDREQTHFSDFYQRDFPQKTGEGPRVRGYQVKSKGGGEPRKNVLAFRTLGAMKNERKQAMEREREGKVDDRAEKLREEREEGDGLEVGISAEDFEVKGLGEKSENS